MCLKKKNKKRQPKSQGRGNSLEENYLTINNHQDNIVIKKLGANLSIDHSSIGLDIYSRLDQAVKCSHPQPHILLRKKGKEVVQDYKKNQHEEYPYLFLLPL